MIRRILPALAITSILATPFNASAEPAERQVEPAGSQLRAEHPEPRGLDWRKPSVAVNMGLLQPLVLDGANVEVDVRVGHFVASYSHGWSLDLEGATVVGDMREQKVALHLPYSSGLGVGYSLYSDSLRSFFDLRLEAKIHRFEAAYTSADGKGRTAIADYSTYTLGGGLYWTLVPFARRSDTLRGLNISTSVRVWPNVASSLSGDRTDYANATTGRTETHRSANIGFADTPVIANISVGYIFQ